MESQADSQYLGHAAEPLEVRRNRRLDLSLHRSAALGSGSARLSTWLAGGIGGKKRGASFIDRNSSINNSAGP